MTMAERVGGVLRLDAAVFENIEADTTATPQALLIVVTASVAAGVGAGLMVGPGVLLRETLGAVVGWIMWAGVTYILGARLLPEPQTRTDMGELLRVIGFSYAPSFVSLLAVIPVVGWVVRPLVAFWLLATMVVAVRQALDYTSTVRAFAVVFIGWLAFVAITWIA